MTATLSDYAKSFSTIQGAFQLDAALLFAAYNQLICAQGISGDVLEIGVHHGLSAIATASLIGPGRRFFAIDLFEELQTQNTSNSGSGDKEIFIRNLEAFYGDIKFIQFINSNSLDLKPRDFGSEFSFCHVDGGHSDNETYRDLLLCSEILLPGGLLALDDYFNPSYPGVSEGAVRFMLNHGEQLIPIAIGFNKVLFQKAEAPFDLNARFSKTFSHVPKAAALLWGRPVNLFWSRLSYFFDLSKSTLQHLKASSSPEVRALIEPQSMKLQAKAGTVVNLPVRIANNSTICFAGGNASFGLSYHILSSAGVMLRHDNTRSFLAKDLEPDEEMLVDLCLVAPREAGDYLIEIDIVWEGVMWFQDKGNPTSIISLSVTDDPPSGNEV
jgi:hypothetical protein